MKKNTKIILIGAGVVAGLCVVCLAAAMIYNATPQGRAGLTATAQVKAVVKTEKASIPTKTSKPTRTPFPTKTPRPTASATPDPAGSVLHTYQIIGACVSDVEAILGTPADQFDIDPGKTEEIPDGGETRLYKTNGLELYVNYDQKQVARGYMIMTGLEEYELYEWKTVLLLLDIKTDLEPAYDDAGRVWTNADGLFIWLNSSKLGVQPIGIVRVYQIP